jgi:hypothetical protein
VGGGATGLTAGIRFEVGGKNRIGAGETESGAAKDALGGYDIYSRSL